MDNDYDISNLIKKFDKQDMCGFTRRFVDNLESSFATEIEIEQDLDWSGVLCLGMGGSAAGGDFLKTLADGDLYKPYSITRCRRKVQELNSDLRGESYNKRKKDMTEKIKEEIRTMK